MEIDFLILADAAQVAEGKLYLLGGGWDRMAINVLPAVQTVGIAVGVIVPWNETNTTHTLRLTIEDEDGATILQPVDVQLEIGRPAGLTAGSDQRITVAFNAHLGLSKLGGYAITAELETGAQKRLRFGVTPGPQFRQDSPPRAGE
ncbi:MAG: hypothetical protein AB7R89_10485 [Dehalococcoidia bacterium]